MKAGFCSIQKFALGQRIVFHGSLAKVTSQLLRPHHKCAPPPGGKRERRDEETEEEDSPRLQQTCPGKVRRYRQGEGCDDALKSRLPSVSVFFAVPVAVVGD
jgi:hypothetical protein